MSAIEQVKAAIIYLDGHCDGAEKQDTVGFNGTDTTFGKSLARQIRDGKNLSPKQIEIAYKMLRKYSKTQLKAGGLTLPNDMDLRAELGGVIAATEKAVVKTVDIVSNQVEVRFDYNATILQAIKSITPKGRYQDNQKGKYWVFQHDQLKQIVDKLLPYGFVFSQSVLDFIQTEQESERIDKEEVDERLEWCIEYLESFVLGRDFKPFAHQWEAVEFFLSRRNKKCIIADAQGLGKALKNDTPVLTPTGWLEIGDIDVGDYVIGSNGLPTEVIGVYPQGEVDLYRITFSDGSTIDCCGEHQWYVEERSNGGHKHTWKTLNTLQMRERGIKVNGVCRYRIPMVKPVEFKERNVLIDPYAIGFILGDGSISQSQTVITTSDIEIIQYFSSIMTDSTWLKQINKYDWAIVGSFGKNYIAQAIAHLGLRGCKAETKFIPECYKFNTYAVRLAVFQGLMDSDGSFSKSSGALQYSSSSMELIEDVKFLVESFGGVARMSEKIPTYTYKGVKKQGKRHYTITISLPPNVEPFRLKRKLDCYVPKSKYQPTRLIKSIEYIGSDKATCISVKALDSLYVTKNCIVTHNTLSSLLAIKAMKAWLEANEGYDSIPVFVVCPVSLKLNWVKEASIVNMPIEVFSYQKMPPPASVPYLIIFDESHAFQNIKSARTEKMLNLCSNDNCMGLIHLTGTPMKNGRPSNLFPLLKACDHRLSVHRSDYEKRYCGAYLNGFGGWDNTGATNLQELRNNIRDVLIRRTKDQCLDLPKKLYTGVSCESNPEAEREYKEMLNNLIDDYEQRAEAGEVSKLSRPVVLLGYLRMCASIYKSYHTINMITELLEQGQSVVVFTEFKESANRIAEAFGVPPLTGDTKLEYRQSMVDDFQAGHTNLFVGTIKAGGVGITLTRASYLIMNDYPFTPGDYHQATDRIHRIGQTRVCNIYNVYGKDIDHVMARIVGQKTANIDKVLHKIKIKEDDFNKPEFYEKLVKQLLKVS